MATHYFPNSIAVDIERGFFKLVEAKRIKYAHKLIDEAMTNLLELGRG
jgi:hypothetical protein